MTPFDYDVFISYRWISPDQIWVRKHLDRALRAAGLRVCLDVTDFVPGRDLILEMTRAGKTSRRALCVLSPDYFDGNRFAQFESLMLRRRDPTGAEGRLIPLVLRPCVTPEWLSGLVPVSWTREEDLDREWRKLVHALEAPAPDAPRPCSLLEAATGIRALPAADVFDVEAATERIQAAKAASDKAEVIAGLVAEVGRRRDPTERYWIYSALAEIGGSYAGSCLRELATRESNPFAKEGAEAALAKVSE